MKVELIPDERGGNPDICVTMDLAEARVLMDSIKENELGAIARGLANDIDGALKAVKYIHYPKGGV